MSYSSMKLPELKAELKKQGLPVGGKKDELIKRLKEAKNDKKEEKEEDDEEEDKPENNREEKEDEKEDSEEDREEDSEEDKKEKKVKGKGKRKADDEVDEAPKSNKRGKVDVDGEGVLAHLTDEEWKAALSAECNKSYFKSMIERIEGDLKSGKEIFPPQNEIFSALNYTPLDKVRVVILGQDPYHDNNQANGLCFSVREGIKIPPSLNNIFKELLTDIPGFTKPKSGSLEKWAHRGVLLLNATLTVQAHTANSHKDYGWMTFTDEIIRILNKKGPKGIVFILWGGFAQKKSKLIDANRNFVIAAAHPSPLSSTKFFGCKVFSKTNAILKKEGYDPIDWTL